MKRNETYNVISQKKNETATHNRKTHKNAYYTGI